MAKKSNRRIAATLALLAAFGYFTTMFIQMFHVVPFANSDYHSSMLELLKAIVLLAFGYYLGSSDSSATKNDILTTKKEIDQ